MDNESTQDERSVIADESTLDPNRTVEDKDLAGENEFLDKGKVSSPTQTHSSPIEAQHAAGNTSSPTRSSSWSNITCLSPNV